MGWVQVNNLIVATTNKHKQKYKLSTNCRVIKIKINKTMSTFFRDYCDDRSVDPLGAEINFVAQYLIVRHETCGLSRLYVHLSAISHYYRAAGLSSPCDNSRIKMMMKGKKGSFYWLFSNLKVCTFFCCFFRHSPWGMWSKDCETCKAHDLRNPGEVIVPSLEWLNTYLAHCLAHVCLLFLLFEVGRPQKTKGVWHWACWHWARALLSTASQIWQNQPVKQGILLLLILLNFLNY